VYAVVKQSCEYSLKFWLFISLNIFSNILRDPFKEQYTNAYSSFKATFTLAEAFNHAVHQIGWIFDRETLPSYLSLSLLQHRIEKVENDENIVRALEENVGDEKHQIALEIVQRCKKLPDLVREWPLKKEDVKYFIDSMENIVAILKLLCGSDDQWKVSRVNGSFCNNDVGWHRPPSFSQVNLI
jgi:hypothetical protein